MAVKRSSVRVLGRTVPLWAVAAALVALSLAIYFPYLDAGFFGDDFIFLSMLEGAVPYNPALGLWYGQWDSIKAFESLWWTEIRGTGGFLRPLASWALTLLYWAFGRNAVPFHATLIILHALAAFAGFLVLRRLSGRDTPALLAALLFLICEDHAMTVGWITTITDLLSAVFLNVAFLCHIIARQERKSWPFALSLLVFLAAIASKETAAAYPLIVAAYEFFFADQLSNEENRISFTKRLRLFLRHGWAWAIPLAVFVAYMVLYRSLVPPMRSLMYLDPFSEPVRYLRMVLINLPIMFVSLLTPFLPSLALMVSGVRAFVAWAGVALTVLLVSALVPYRRERALWLSLVVFVLGLLPGLATEPGERLLYFPSVYGLFVVAWFVTQIRPLRRLVTPDGPPGVRILGPIWAGYLLVAVGIVPVVLLFVFPAMFIPGFQLPEKTVLKSLSRIEEGKHEHVVFLNTNSSFNSFYLPDIYRYHRGAYVDFHLLSSFNGRVMAKQESERVLLLKTQDVGWLSNMFARVVRVKPRFRVGEAHRTKLFTATILAITPNRRDVQEVRFELVLPLDDPSIVLLYYDGRTYRRWEPSPDWTLLNATIDPWGF